MRTTALVLLTFQTIFQLGASSTQKQPGQTESTLSMCSIIGFISHLLCLFLYTAIWPEPYCYFPTWGKGCILYLTVWVCQGYWTSFITWEFQDYNLSSQDWVAWTVPRSSTAFYELFIQHGLSACEYTHQWFGKYDCPSTSTREALIVTILVALALFRPSLGINSCIYCSKHSSRSRGKGHILGRKYLGIQASRRATSRDSSCHERLRQVYSEFHPPQRY
jgi:hypothetical protein